MSLLLAIFVFFLKRKIWLWLVLPLGLILDFWRIEPLGKSGLVIMSWYFVFWVFLGGFTRKKYKIRV